MKFPTSFLLTALATTSTANATGEMGQMQVGGDVAVHGTKAVTLRAKASKLSILAGEFDDGAATISNQLVAARKNASFDRQITLRVNFTGNSQKLLPVRTTTHLR